MRTVEQGNRNATPFVGAPRMQGGGKPVKKGTFEGNWNIGEQKAVTVCDTTQTLSVMNLTMDWCGEGVGEGVVLFTKACGTHTAIEIGVDQCKNIGGAINKIAGFDNSAVQLLGHDEGGCLKWYDIFECPSTAS